MNCIKTFGLAALGFLTLTNCQANKANEVKDLIVKVNTKWQADHKAEVRSFWDDAAYHTANMEVYRLLGDTAMLNYSRRWAEHNQWMGATEPDTSKWIYDHYGEKPQFVLFGDWQACFQVYADFYRFVEANPEWIARANEVMKYQMRTQNNDYWYWSDALYMVMPVMTRMYQVTSDTQYLDKLYDYWFYARNLMFDDTTHLYYRDAKYIYPKHTSVNGHKDFWARGCGWVIAAWARVLEDLPAEDQHRAAYEENFRLLAEAFKNSQQPEGYWTRSILDPEHAPGPETSGSAFACYGIQWGINNGLLNSFDYQPCADKAWEYLTTLALQPDFTIGYVQPIGEKAIPGQTVNAKSQYNFGTGAFLLAAIERYRLLTNK